MSVGVVVIGRNEGQRLVNCLKSIHCDSLVYVDSGSTDGSLDNARQLGALTVELDLSIPFTAARARNAGFQRLIEQAPDVQYVFFVDGDCQVAPHWLEQAKSFLDDQPDVAVVCGRRKEIYPLASVYNAFCDIEWDRPAGETRSCGGDALFRVEVLKRLGGYDPSFIAGEEPELCFRIRQLGLKIVRVDEEMTFHDANMTQIKQWWKRSERSGHAYFLGWHKHGKASDERFNAQQIRSILVWSGISFVCLLWSLITLSCWGAILLVLVVFAQTSKIFFRLDKRHNHFSSRIRFLYSLSVFVGKWPQAIGVINAYLRKVRGKQATLVEYK